MKYRCGSRNNKDGMAGFGKQKPYFREWKCWLEAETNSIKMAVQVEAERWRWQCRCGSRNSRDGSAGVEA